MKLLLHVCCAPCAMALLVPARSDGYSLMSYFFYNPNIQPSGEFLRRKNEALSLAKSQGADFIEPGYAPDEYFTCVKDYDNHERRCRSCWSLRLEKTARAAKEGGFDAFSTTLLASPYQEHESLKDIAQELSERYNVKFYYRDFRTGFRQAHDEARAKGIYCQNYCGCVFSMIERFDRKKAARL